MLLKRWQPFAEVRSEFSRLQEEMDRVFGRRSASATTRFGRPVYPLLNLWEDENNLYVEAEVPGLDRDDLEIHVTGDKQLSIKGERKQHVVENGTWYHQERGQGSFNRSVALPGDVEREQVTAEFKHGVLTITLPKREEVKPRRIEVKTA